MSAAKPFLITTLNHLKLLEVQGSLDCCKHSAYLSSGLFTIGNNLDHMHVYSETKNYSDFFVD